MAAMVGLCKREAGTAAHRRVDSHLAHLPILHRQAYAHAFQAELLIDGDLAGNARLWQTAVGTRGGIAVPYHAIRSPMLRAMDPVNMVKARARCSASANVYTT